MRIFKDLSIIITLFNTPHKKLENLKEFKGIKTLVFNQENRNDYNNLKKALKFDFKYYFSKNNIGFSKSTNFLISKIKTKYFLFTQPDIIIKKNSIKYLLNEIKKNKKTIFVGPSFKHGGKTVNKILKKEYLNAACMMCDTSKVKKIGFFDEDYFLYWNDEDLMKRTNHSPFKMIQVLKAKAIHESSKSSLENFTVKFIRSKHFKLGELIFDYKFNKLRLLKVLRQFIQSLLKLILFTLILNKEKILINFAYLMGILNFCVFYIKKKIVNEK